eukprot:Hpha_TRINITY_DN3000_c0_g1::TRINITY_DN3000_c0_g1_i1::g.138653::m.138653
MLRLLMGGKGMRDKESAWGSASDGGTPPAAVVEPKCDVKDCRTLETELRAALASAEGLVEAQRQELERLRGLTQEAQAATRVALNELDHAASQSRAAAADRREAAKVRQQAVDMCGQWSEELSKRERAVSVREAECVRRETRLEVLCPQMRPTGPDPGKVRWSDFSATRLLRPVSVPIPKPALLPNDASCVAFDLSGLDRSPGLLITALRLCTKLRFLSIFEARGQVWARCPSNSEALALCRATLPPRIPPGRTVPARDFGEADARPQGGSRRWVTVGNLPA